MNNWNELISASKEMEGFSPFAYDDLQPGIPAYELPEILGTLTIGYGHTGADVYPDSTITEKQATDQLLKDLNIAKNEVERRVSRYLIPGQKMPLVSHTFNTGGSDQLFDLVNDQRHDLTNIGNWWTTTYITSQGQELEGLKKRRELEFEQFSRATQARRIITGFGVFFLMLILIFGLKNYLK